MAFCKRRYVHMFVSQLYVQLLNKGEKSDKGYAEAVPWLEAAAFGGFLNKVEVSALQLLLGSIHRVLVF